MAVTAGALRSTTDTTVFSNASTTDGKESGSSVSAAQLDPANATQLNAHAHPRLIRASLAHVLRIACPSDHA